MNGVEAGVQSTLMGLTLEKLGWAALTLVVCLLLVRIFMKWAGRALGRLPLQKTLLRYATSAVRLILYLTVGLVVADKLGIPIASMVTLLGVIGLAFSLAIQDSLANLFSGLTILVSKPFVVGDYVEAGDVGGTVESIGLIYTRFLTPDNKLVLLPNKQTVSSKIVNYTHQPSRRVEVKVSASYAAAPEQVKQALLRAAGHVAHLDEPAPFAGLNAYGASGAEYVLRVWSEAAGYWDAYYQLMERVKDEFERAGIEIPYAQVDIRVRKDPE